MHTIAPSPFTDAPHALNPGVRQHLLSHPHCHLDSQQDLTHGGNRNSLQLDEKNATASCIIRMSAFYDFPIRFLCVLVS